MAKDHQQEPASAAAAGYTSPDIQIAWVEHEGNQAIYFGRHPWRVINRLKETQHYDNGAGDLLVQIFIHVVKHQAPPEAAAESFPSGLSIEWFLPDDEDDPQKQDAALMIFRDPTLPNVALHWGLPLDQTQHIIFLQIVDQIERLAKRQFGTSLMSGFPSP